jgi:hypothetical protein
MQAFETPTRLVEGPVTRRATHRLARICNRLLFERPWRAKEDADPLSAFDRDPDDGPESEGLMHYGH